LDRPRCRHDDPRPDRRLCDWRGRSEPVEVNLLFAALGAMFAAWKWEKIGGLLTLAGWPSLPFSA